MADLGPEFMSVNPDHVPLMESALRAPSAHNAQPWKVKPLADGHTYEVHYWQTPDLPHDYDNKDAYLTMGAFVETLVLEAPNLNLQTVVEPNLTREDEDLSIATIVVGPKLDEVVDPLSNWIGKRHTNRNRYSKEQLPLELEEQLRHLGNVLINPSSLAPVVKEASSLSWRNPQFIEDLKNWFRKDNSAEDGITPLPFNISKSDMVGLKLAFWRGGFKSKLMGDLYSSQDVGDFNSAASAAIISVEEMTPQEMFDAGRRLLRSWVTIISHGFSYQPFSVAVDERATVGKVADIAGVSNPVALYRIGKAVKLPKGNSNRKPLSKVIV